MIYFGVLLVHCRHQHHGDDSRCPFVRPSTIEMWLYAKWHESYSYYVTQISCHGNWKKTKNKPMFERGPVVGHPLVSLLPSGLYNIFMGLQLYDTWVVLEHMMRSGLETFPHCYPFVRNLQLPVDPGTKEQKCRSLAVSLLLTWITFWTNNRLPVNWNAFTLTWRHCNGLYHIWQW